MFFFCCKKSRTLFCYVKINNRNTLCLISNNWSQKGHWNLLKWSFDASKLTGNFEVILRVNKVFFFHLSAVHSYCLIQGKSNLTLKLWGITVFYVLTVPISEVFRARLRLQASLHAIIVYILIYLKKIDWAISWAFYSFCEIFLSFLCNKNNKNFTSLNITNGLIGYIAIGLIIYTWNWWVFYQSFAIIKPNKRKTNLFFLLSHCVYNSFQLNYLIKCRISLREMVRECIRSIKFGFCDHQYDVNFIHLYNCLYNVVFTIYLCVYSVQRWENQ